MNLNRTNAVASDGRFFVPLMCGIKGVATVCCEDEAKWGTYRTKDTFLDIYDVLAEARRTGQPYQTRLHPGPADPCAAHPANVRGLNTHAT